MFQHDAANTGYTPDETGPSNNITKRSYGIQGSTGAVVVNGTVYLASAQGILYAINESTSTVVWRYPTGGHVLSAPTVVDGSVYVWSTNRSTGGAGTIHALSARTGTKQWDVATPNIVKVPLTVYDKTIYVGGFNGSLFALDTATGEEEWRFTAMDTLQSPAVANDSVYIGSSDGRLYELDKATGLEQWYFESGYAIRTAPTITENSIYFGDTNGDFYALKRTSGVVKWRLPLGTSITTSAGVANGVVYIPAITGSGQTTTLYALRDTDGTELWRVDGDFVSPPAITDESIYIDCSKSNSISGYCALSPTDGRTKWFYRSPPNVVAPALSNDTVYFGDDILESKPNA